MSKMTTESISSSSYILDSGSPSAHEQSFVDEDDSFNTDSHELDSLPSSTETDSSEEESDAERQWHESLQQVELLLTMVLVPYLGRYFGRKCAYWGRSIQPVRFSAC